MTAHPIANPFTCGLCKREVTALTTWSVCKRCTRKNRLPAPKVKAPATVARGGA